MELLIINERFRRRELTNKVKKLANLIMKKCPQVIGYSSNCLCGRGDEEVLIRDKTK